MIEKTLDDKQKDIVNKGDSADIVLSIKNATDNNLVFSVIRYKI